MRRLIGALIAVAALVAPATASASPGGGTITVQTYNLNLGADLTPLFGATDIASLRAGAAKIYGEVTESRPDERMRAVAAIIARQRPDVVGLQEVALWSLAPYATMNGIPVATGPYRPSYDFLALLLRDLARHGLRYQAASINTNFDSGTAVPIAIPISDRTAARYTDRNVVLVRPHVAVSDPRQADYQGANNVAYGTLVAAGLAEVWPLVHPGDPCSPARWTSGQSSIHGPVSTLDHRIDDVFLSAGVRALHTTVVGDTARELSRPHGLWPSDHASTVARLQVRR